MCDHEHNDIYDNYINHWVTLERIEHDIDNSTDDKQVPIHMMGNLILRQNSIQQKQNHFAAK